MCISNTEADTADNSNGRVAAPRVWPWHVAYCIVLALVYTALIPLFIWMLSGPIVDDPDAAAEMYFSGLVMLVLTVPLAAAFWAAPFLPKKPWAWVYHLVLICIGMTSACCLPACIPLLIFWIKPDTKQFFGRDVA